MRTLSSTSLRSESRASNRTPEVEEPPLENEASTIPTNNEVSDSNDNTSLQNNEQNEAKDMAVAVAPMVQEDKDAQSFLETMASHGEDLKSKLPEQSLQPVHVETEAPTTIATAVSPSHSDEVFEDAPEFSGSEGPKQNDEGTSDTELYSMDSDEHPTEATTANTEVLLVLEGESQVDSSIARTSSNTSIGSHSSQSETSKIVLKEFVPSGDPSKQNLSELVEDTQRLIKQMREEISMDEFESTDEDDYSDEYSDEYDEGEEEEWYDSEGEEEGDYEGEDGNTFNEHTSFIEEASTGDEGTEIEDIMEEDEDQLDEDDSNPTQTAPDHESIIPPSSSVTPTNHEADSVPETEVVSSAGISPAATNDSPATETISPQQNGQEETKTVTPLLPPETEILPVEESPVLVEEVEPEAETPTEAVLEPDEEPAALPIIPDPPIVDSESRPVELPVETVLEEPKKVTPSTKAKTVNKTTGNTEGPTPKTTKSTVSKIPKPTTEPTPANKKLPLRSKSFSAPMGISSVKRIQQEYLQKQSTTSAASRVPLKSTPTTKKSISDAITRFNSNSSDGPSTSGAAAAAAALLKPRSQPRIPKKKYHETCFSDDDYETSATEEELEDQSQAEPLKAELLKRKLSMPVFRAYPSVQEPVIEEPAVCTSQK